jgi:putative ABC transport system ATP-binding protein
VRWLADHLRGGRADAEGMAKDRSAIAALGASGVDITGPRDVAYRLLLPDDVSGRLVAELIHQHGRTVMIDPPGKGAGSLVTVVVHHELTPDAIGGLRAEFEAVAGGMGGSFEGWSIAGERTDSIATAVRLSDVVKAYGAGEVAVHALRGITLQVPAGQILVVLGPSGSGKTTLMNLVGGMEPATSGTVEVAGQDLARLDDAGLTVFRRETIGFVFQFFNLVPTLTALENVQLVAELVGRPEPEVAVNALRAVGLEGRGDHFPSALSGGEQQRVAIARAIVKDPPILLCDEPTGSLDLDTGRQVLAVLHRLSRAAGRSVLLVTHNAAIATIADRVIRMRSGEIVEDRAIHNPSAPEAISW